MFFNNLASGCHGGACGWAHPTPRHSQTLGIKRHSGNGVGLRGPQSTAGAGTEAFPTGEKIPRDMSHLSSSAWRECFGFPALGKPQMAANVAKISGLPEIPRCNLSFRGRSRRRGEEAILIKNMKYLNFFQRYRGRLVLISPQLVLTHSNLSRSPLLCQDWFSPGHLKE